MLKNIKELAIKSGMEFSDVLYMMYLNTELGNSFKPSIDILDDLYTSFVSGIIGNFHKDLKPEFIEELSPMTKENRHTKEGYEKLKKSLTYELGYVAIPKETWKTTILPNLSDIEQEEIIKKSMNIDKSFNDNPELWLSKFRNKLKKY